MICRFVRGAFRHPLSHQNPLPVFMCGWFLTALLLVTNGVLHAASLEEQLLAESTVSLAEEARRSGDATRGAAIFHSRVLACSTCHRLGETTQSIGPDLARKDVPLSDPEIVEAVLLPSKRIAKEYVTVQVTNSAGQVITGTVAEESDAVLTLRSAASPDTLVSVNKSELEDRHVSTESLMPAGQVNQLGERQRFIDLVRYLIEIREGGLERARELQPPPDPLAQKIPDEPSPFRPVVQRGEMQVSENHYPHAVSLGFVGGTLIFDAEKLRTVAVWHDGFIHSSPQNYFGLYWHASGTPTSGLEDPESPLRFRTPGSAAWSHGEPAVSSDPNQGTRYDGHQIGRSFVRLRYRQKVGDDRVAVVEDVRVEHRSSWLVIAREYRVEGLSRGTEVALAVPGSERTEWTTIPIASSSGSSDASIASLLHSQQGGKHLVMRHRTTDGTYWQRAASANPAAWQVVSQPAGERGAATIRLEEWSYRGPHPAPTAEELQELARAPMDVDDSFDAPAQPARPLPPVPELAAQTKKAILRPAVQAKQNEDTFEATEARFLRFTVKRTADGSEPGLDELEVYGPESDANLALEGKATASSVIPGYAIHQIAHLNDGVIGNEHSWISAEANGGWAMIELPRPMAVNKVIWARDRTGVCGDRVIASYRIEVSSDGQAWRTVSDEEGREQWGALGATVRRDAADGYEMESIPGPFPTWRPSDVIFDGDVMYAIAMTEGQVWRSRIPPPGQPERVQWHRVASGLYHPIGLAIVDGRLFVAQKPEITELIDRDGDGVTDIYRTIATGWGLSTGWHEYCFGLAVDPDKNLWFALNTGYFWTNPGYVNPGRWRGGIFRVNLASETLEPMATGCRVPNGITQGPDGGIFFTDNQGDWIQACKLAHVVPGRFYGHPETTQDALPADQYPTGRSAVWLPYEHCRSVSGPVFDSTHGKFGPFANQMFVGDVGYGANPGIMRVALEKVNGEFQGACFRFIDGQPLGCQRMRFGPDHQLYQTSLTSGLTRVAFNGRTPMSFESVRIRPRGEGFVVKLTRPVSSDAIISPQSIQVTRYHYLYTGNYGSPKADEQSVTVQNVELSADRTELTLTLPVETYPIGMVYQIHVGALKSDDGQELKYPDAWYTVHAIPQ